MQDTGSSSATIYFLQQQVAKLQAENALLKSLLDKAGISYAAEEVIRPDSGTGDSILQIEITRDRARLFFSYFWGRTDVFSKRFQSKATGKAGYFPQCNNFWIKGLCPKATGTKIKCKDCKNRSWTKLQAEHIEKHLRGTRQDGCDVIGVYPLFPDGTCRFLAFDFDNHAKGAESLDLANEDENWKEEVDSLREICRLNSVPILVERSRSGRGAHIWVFFDKPIEAGFARKFGSALLDKGADNVNIKSFRFYDRMLPAQDSVPQDGLGNLIALPLQGRALKSSNSAFIDENWRAYPDQWLALSRTKRLSRKQMEILLEAWKYKEDSEGAPNKQLPSHEDDKPWERSADFHKEDVDGEMQVVLANMAFINSSNLKPRIQNQIRRLAAFSNPAFFRNHAIGFSNYSTPRYIYLGGDDNGYIHIPRGLYEILLQKCNSSHIACRVEDKRSEGNNLKIQFKGELRDNQQKAVNKLLNHDCGIISAATAFGKTVACCSIISRKHVSTLILLESSALIEQWRKAIDNFLELDEEPPEYTTKTGRIKHRSSIIGIIQGAKDTSTGIIDIAMAGSLRKKDEFHPRLKDYGLVLVDECHHSASETLSSVLNQVNAKYVYGVTATPMRMDGLEKISYMLLGPVRFQFSAKEKAAEQNIPHLVIPRFTRVTPPPGSEKQHVNASYECIRDSGIRNEQIVSDIKSCVSSGKTPVVLTKYTGHAEKIYEMVREYADKAFLLTGKKTKKEQLTLRREMEQVRSDESMILVATGQLIGEGFDFPRLDTLIMATPVAWKGVVEQYAGRLNRDYEGKSSVMIYDYIDHLIPVFDRMYTKRLKAYKRIGYQIATLEKTGKQSANAIFDSDTYCQTYEKDLLGATKEIIISSPTLGRSKVRHLIHILKERQEDGVMVAVLTWHPEIYVHGKDENRTELISLMRNSGFHIELVKANCRRFAIIDNDIVWYGSMNLLSKDNVEDNIMRIASKDIAAELLALSFQNETTQYKES